jgi:hypothetical protein
VTVLTGGTSITCTTPTGTTGPVAVQVTNPDNQSGLLNNAFTYLAPIASPTVTGISPAFGPVTGGTQVTVLGTNFQVGASVRLGTIAATAVNVISPSAIIVTIPGQSGPGNVSVTVTNPDSQLSTLPNSFNYFQPANLPALSIVSLSPNQGATAGGTSVFISGAGFKSGSTVRFGAVNATSVQYLGPSALLVTTPASPASTVAVTVVNPDASSTTLGAGFNFNDGIAFRLPPSRLPLTPERGYSLTRLFDIDNDGDLDAYLGRYNENYDSDGKDKLWINDGTGTFVEDPNFVGDGRNNTQDVVIADFDGNGTKDMFVIPGQAAWWDPSQNDRARLIRNAPLGVYTVIPQSPIVGCCSGVPQRAAQVGDLNSDGFLDVFVATNAQDYYYRNERDGGFAPTRAGLPGVSDDSSDSCIADFDRDGDDDLFVVNTNNQQASYYLQGPAGVFTISNSLIPVVGGIGTGCVAAQFRPGSGIKDIVVVKDGQLYQYLLNDGTGRFVDQAATINVNRLPSTPPSLRISRKPFAVDFDSDGDLDLVMRHPDLDPRHQVYINDGTGFFAVGTATRMPPFLDADSEPAFGDVNSDGRPDLLIPGDGVQSRLLLNSATGLKYATMKTIPEQSYCATDSDRIDIDGDGDQDLVITQGCKRTGSNYQTEPSACRGDKLRIWVNDGAGGFTDQTSTRFPATTYNMTSIKVGDMDRDGDLDIVVGAYTGFNIPATNQSVYLYLNNGAGVFTDATYPRIPNASPNYVNGLALADVNKDGALDILETGSNSWPCFNASSMKLYLNTGNGFFFNVSNQLPYQSIYGTGQGCREYPTSYSVGDFNRDGYLDLVLSASQARSRLWFNSGAASPGFFTDVTNSNLPSVIDDSFGSVVKDFNNDTFLDLFVCNAATDRLSLGNSLGILSDVSATNWPGESQPYPYQSIATGNFGPVSSESCDATDVDLDGDQDIIVAGGPANGFNHRNRLYVNSGSALFTDATTQLLPYDTVNTQKVLFFRANADTRPDLFVGNCGQPYVMMNGP